MDRLEVHHQDNELNYTVFKPVSRRLAANSCEAADSLHHFYPYDYFYEIYPIDKYNLRSLLMNNREWVQGSKDSFASRKPLFKALYKDKANFFAVETKDFFLAVNPVFQYQQSFESASSERVFLNSKGVAVRGMIARRIGFDAYITDNQERG